MSVIDKAGLNHWLKNSSLIILSLPFLPIDSLIVVAIFAFDFFFPSSTDSQPKTGHAKAPKNAKIVLVTGVSMSKGLVLARLFYQQGWTVIGADFSPLACGRFSQCLERYYTARKPDEQTGSARYVADLLEIISKHKVDLWVSGSSVASAVEDGEAKEAIETRTKCTAIQFDVETTRMLLEKHTFLQRAAYHGLQVPDTHFVTSRQEVEAALQQAPLAREYIMKPIGADDANRGDMTRLSKARFEEAAKHLDRLNVSEKNSWILQQFINGPEYCTHALVVRGQVKAFVACQSAELLMHYTALSQHSALCKAMLRFTETFAEKEGTAFTGHLSFDFMVEYQEADEGGEDVVLYPIECNPRAHTAVVLFQDHPELIDAYAFYLESPRSATTADGSPINPRSRTSFYWVGHDLVELLLQPVWKALLGQDTTKTIAVYVDNLKTLTQHIAFWHDGTLVRWDPLPW